MPTLSKTIGTSGADYTTLQDWWDDIGVQIGGTNLVTAGYTSVTGTIITDLVWSTTGSMLDDSIGFSYTTDSSHVINLTSAAQDYGTGLLWATGHGFTLTSSSTNKAPIFISSGENINISNLRVQGTGWTAATINGPVVFSKCVFNSTSASRTVSSGETTGGVTWNNCLFYNSGSNVGEVVIAAGATDVFNFCTFAVPSDYGQTLARLVYAAVAATFTDCAFFSGGKASAFNDGASGVYSHCASDMGTVPTGVTGSLTYVNQFKGTTIAGGIDYRVLNASANIYGAGVTVGGITTDIAGNTRKSPPDIGASELPASAGGGGGGLLLFGGSVGWTPLLRPLPLLGAAAWQAGKAMRRNATLGRRRLLLGKW